ncbi:MAG: hypothetical protein ACKOXZ_01965, partial [Polynucleobacter victoriensis]
MARTLRNIGFKGLIRSTEIRKVFHFETTANQTQSTTSQAKQLTQMKKPTLFRVGFNQTKSNWLNQR